MYNLAWHIGSAGLVLWICAGTLCKSSPHQEVTARICSQTLEAFHHRWLVAAYCQHLVMEISSIFMAWGHTLADKFTDWCMWQRDPALRPHTQTLWLGYLTPENKTCFIFLHVLCSYAVLLPASCTLSLKTKEKCVCVVLRNVCYQPCLSFFLID